MKRRLLCTALAACLLLGSCSQTPTNVVKETASEGTTKASSTTTAAAATTTTTAETVTELAEETTTSEATEAAEAAIETTIEDSSEQEISESDLYSYYDVLSEISEYQNGLIWFKYVGVNDRRLEKPYSWIANCYYEKSSYSSKKEYTISYFAKDNYIFYLNLYLNLFGNNVFISCYDMDTSEYCEDIISNSVIANEVNASKSYEEEMYGQDVDVERIYFFNDSIYFIFNIKKDSYIFRFDYKGNTLGKLKLVDNNDNRITTSNITYILPNGNFVIDDRLGEPYIVAADLQTLEPIKTYTLTWTEEMPHGRPSEEHTMKSNLDFADGNRIYLYLGTPFTGQTFYYYELDDPDNFIEYEPPEASESSRDIYSKLCRETFVKTSSERSSSLLSENSAKCIVENGYIFFRYGRYFIAPNGIYDYVNNSVIIYNKYADYLRSCALFGGEYNIERIYSGDCKHWCKVRYPSDDSDYTYSDVDILGVENADDYKLHILNDKYYLLEDEYGVFLRTFEKGEAEETELPFKSRYYRGPETTTGPKDAPTVN